MPGAGDLRRTLSHVHRLEGTLPVCSGCRRVRDDEGNWSGLDEYLQHRTGVAFSHGLCSACTHSLFQPALTGSDGATALPVLRPPD